MNYENIKTWEDACKVRNIDPTKLPDLSMIPVNLQKYIMAQYKLAVITEAINTDKNGKVWQPNWSDGSSKYSPWFEVDADEEHPAGVGFSNARYDYRGTRTGVGSRLCFDTSEKVYHIEKYFEELHLDQQLIREYNNKVVRCLGCFGQVCRRQLFEHELR